MCGGWSRLRRDRVSGSCLYWSASRHWYCFYTGQPPEVESPKAKSKGKVHSRITEDVGGGSGLGSLAGIVQGGEGWGLAIGIVMVGWVLEMEAGCKS